MESSAKPGGPRPAGRWLFWPLPWFRPPQINIPRNSSPFLSFAPSISFQPGELICRRIPNHQRLLLPSFPLLLIISLVPFLFFRTRRRYPDFFSRRFIRLILAQFVVFVFPIGREMAEEQRCGEGHRLCANNCGFFGSPAMLGLCSKCYRDYRLKEDQASSAKIAVEKSLQPASSSSAASTATSALAVEPSTGLGPVKAAEEVEKGKVAQPPHAQPGRCTACRKRVGLMGFRCRCGDTYCGAHRYPQQHGCTFDFKAAGREAIARANPIVKAEKLDNKI